MPKAPLAADYARLSPRERFQLAIVASARQDERELARLRQPSLTRPDRAADAKTAGRFLDCHRIVMAGWAQFWEDAYRAYLLYCVASDALRIEMAPPGEKQDAAQLARRLLAVFLGLAWFCESIGCEPLVVLRAYWPPLALRVEAFVEAFPPTFCEWGDEGPDENQREVFDTAGEIEELLALGSIPIRLRPNHA